MTISIPHRCATCGSASFNAFGECVRCHGVFTEPDIVTLIARVAADECADHAALRAAVRSCRQMIHDGGVWIPRADWERVWGLVREGE